MITKLYLRYAYIIVCVVTFRPIFQYFRFFILRICRDFLFSSTLRCCRQRTVLLSVFHKLVFPCPSGEKTVFRKAASCLAYLISLFVLFPFSLSLLISSLVSWILFLIYCSLSLIPQLSSLVSRLLFLVFGLGFFLSHLCVQQRNGGVSLE